MKLSRKVFYYTAATTFAVGIMIIGYFMFMLPGLYVEYKSQRFLEQVIEVQKRSVAQEPDAGTAISDNLYLMNLQVPDDSNEIILSNQYFTSTVEIIQPRLQEMLDQFRSQIEQIEQLEDADKKDFELSFDEQLWHSFIEEVQVDQFFKVKQAENHVVFIDAENPMIDFHQLADGSIIITSEVRDQTNQYTAYIGFNHKEGVTYLTIASTMTPKLTELSPIILISTPMIVLLLILLAVLTASWFSRQLAEPIETLAKQASSQRNQDNIHFKQKSNGAEFKVLENALNDMNQRIQSTVQQLQIQNVELAQEKEKQELFMMNASHQLKTPIAAASLLVEGMIQKVGKYAETEVYLPSVKQELNRLSQIIEKILHIFADTNQSLDQEEVSVNQLVCSCQARLQNQIQTKHLQVETQMTEVKLVTDAHLFLTIIENILENAVKYTPEGGTLKIAVDSEKLSVCNTGCAIEHELLPRIHEPFVRSAKNQAQGTGLGLYLVDTFTKMLDFTWSIENHETSMPYANPEVCVTIYFERGNDK